MNSAFEVKDTPSEELPLDIDLLGNLLSQIYSFVYNLHCPLLVSI